MYRELWSASEIQYFPSVLHINSDDQLGLINHYARTSQPLINILLTQTSVCLVLGFVNLALQIKKGVFLAVKTMTRVLRVISDGSAGR